MSRPLTILVAEDNQDDFFFLHRVLKRAGVASVHHVDNGQSAVDYLAGEGPYRDRKRHPFPDIVLLDLRLPRLSGHQVLEWIGMRKRRKHPHTFLISGSASEIDQERAQEAGADGFFLKPLSLGHIAALFEAVTRHGVNQLA